MYVLSNYHHDSCYSSYNCEQKNVIVTQGILALIPDELITVKMASYVNQCVSIEVIAPFDINEPLTLSIIFSMYKL